MLIVADELVGVARIEDRQSGATLDARHEFIDTPRGFLALMFDLARAFSQGGDDRTGGRLPGALRDLARQLPRFRCDPQCHDLLFLVCVRSYDR